LDRSKRLYYFELFTIWCYLVMVLVEENIAIAMTKEFSILYVDSSIIIALISLIITWKYGAPKVVINAYKPKLDNRSNSQNNLTSSLKHRTKTKEKIQGKIELAKNNQVPNCESVTKIPLAIMTMKLYYIDNESNLIDVFHVGAQR
jgi:hypothetical protein